MLVWSVLLLRPFLEGTRFTVRTDHAALKWMLHMDGAHGRQARWRMRLLEYDYVIETGSGASHRAADAMSRLATTEVDEGPIPDVIPCLLFPASSAAWTEPTYPTGLDLSPITCKEFLDGQADDPRFQEIQREINENPHSRFSRRQPRSPRSPSPDGQGATGLSSVPFQQGLLMREYYPAHAGHPGANKMYAAMRRWVY